MHPQAQASPESPAAPAVDQMPTLVAGINRPINDEPKKPDSAKRQATKRTRPWLARGEAEGCLKLLTLELPKADGIAM